MTTPPPDDRISAYLDGELPAAEHFEVQQLLVTSAEWRAELDAVAWARVSVRAMPAQLAPRGWWDEVRRTGPQEAKPRPKPTRRDRRRRDDDWPLAHPVSPADRDLDVSEPKPAREPLSPDAPSSPSEPPASFEPVGRSEPARPVSPLPLAPPPRLRHTREVLGPVVVPPTPLELPRKLAPPEQAGVDAHPAGVSPPAAPPEAPPAEVPPAEPPPEDAPAEVMPEPTSPGALTRRVRRPPTRHQPFPVDPADAPVRRARRGMGAVPGCRPDRVPGRRARRTAHRAARGVPAAHRRPTRPTPVRPREYPPRRVSRSAKVLVATGAAVVVALIAVVLPSRGSVEPRLPEVADSHSVRSSVSDDPVTQLATLSSVASFRR